MSNSKPSFIAIFEKVAALLFLVLTVGIIAFLTYVPLPKESEQPVLIIIGVLSSSCVQAVPKLFGSDEAAAMEIKFKELDVKYNQMKENFDRISEMLVAKAFPDEG